MGRARVESNRLPRLCSSEPTAFVEVSKLFRSYAYNPAEIRVHTVASQLLDS